MKYIFALSLSLLSFATIANDTPFVEKYADGGYTEELEAERCGLFSGYTMKTIYRGESVKSTMTAHRIDSKVLIDLINASEKETVTTTPNDLCDFPFSSVKAFPRTPRVTTEIVLFTTGGCGEERIVRSGPATTELNNLLDSHCALTNP